MLTDTKCRNAKPTEKPYKLTDSNGLLLEVKPNGVKAWRYRFEVFEKGMMKGISCALRMNPVSGSRPISVSATVSCCSPPAWAAWPFLLWCFICFTLSCKMR